MRGNRSILFVNRPILFKIVAEISQTHYKNGRKTYF